jgi:hypothetical protein
LEIYLLLLIRVWLFLEDVIIVVVDHSFALKMLLRLLLLYVSR